jgi:hypothetical protein
VLALREDALCGDGDAISFISTHTTKKQQIRTAAKAIIDEELLVLHSPVVPQDQQHAKAVLEHTVLRYQGMIRGRIVGGDASFPAVHWAQRVKDRCAKLTAIGSGDWTIPRCIHVEQNCCNDAHGNFCRQICCEKFFAGVVDAGVLADELQSRPSTNRWGSLQEHESEQLLGHFFHNLHPRACALAFQRWEDGAVALDDESDDYRQMVKGKAFRTVAKTSDETYT